MPERKGFSQRAKSFIKEIGLGTVNATDAIGQSTANLTDAEFAMRKRLVEKRDPKAIHATVAPVDTAQYHSPGSPTPETPFDACGCVDMKENNVGKMNLEPTELESPSAGTGLRTPGQQCSPNGVTGRTTADDCLLVGMGSNSGGNTFFPAEIAVGARPDSKSTTPPAASNTIFLKASHKPEDKEKGGQENKQFDPGEKKREATALKRGCNGIAFLFWGERWAWDARCLCFVFFCLLFYQVIIFQRAESP